MLVEWLSAGIGSVLFGATILWRCHAWQQRHEAGRLVKAIESEDEVELSMQLAEGANIHSVREWFGEPALILAVKHSTVEAVRLLALHGATIDEPGTEWKTALMHAAANGNQNLCVVLMSYGADPAACDLFGRTAADWARHEGHHRLASILRSAEGCDFSH
jgi:ankyrin repeat protein